MLRVMDEQFRQRWVELDRKRVWLDLLHYSLATWVQGRSCKVKRGVGGTIVGTRRLLRMVVLHTEPVNPKGVLQVDVN